jgi:hypothetical protein
LPPAMPGLKVSGVLVRLMKSGCPLIEGPITACINWPPASDQLPGATGHGGDDAGVRRSRGPITATALSTMSA